MGFALTQGVSFCAMRDQLLFLDLHRDRYFCLAPSAERAFCKLIAADPLDEDSEHALLGLVERGLLRTTQEDLPPAACVGPGIPEATLLDTNRRCGRATVIRASIDLFSVRRALRRQRWAAVLARLAHDKSQLDPLKTSDDALAEIATAFQRLGGFISAIDQCVPRSVAVMRRSLGMGLAPTLVIGVRLRPFAAHCWVQHQHMLVNERVDLARNFTPILTI